MLAENPVYFQIPKHQEVDEEVRMLALDSGLVTPNDFDVAISHQRKNLISLAAADVITQSGTAMVG